jgi:hypothetical protein
LATSTTTTTTKLSALIASNDRSISKCERRWNARPQSFRQKRALLFPGRRRAFTQTTIFFLESIGHAAADVFSTPLLGVISDVQLPFRLIQSYVIIISD